MGNHTRIGLGIAGFALTMALATFAGYFDAIWGFPLYTLIAISSIYFLRHKRALMHTGSIVAVATVTLSVERVGLPSVGDPFFNAIIQAVIIMIIPTWDIITIGRQRKYRAAPPSNWPVRTLGWDILALAGKGVLAWAAFSLFALEYRAWSHLREPREVSAFVQAVDPTHVMIAGLTALIAFAVGVTFSWSLDIVRGKRAVTAFAWPAAFGIASLIAARPRHPLATPLTQIQADISAFGDVIFFAALVASVALYLRHRTEPHYETPSEGLTPIQ